MAHQTSSIQTKDVSHVETAALPESDLILRDFFEFAPDAIVVVNGQGEIVRVNSQAEALFGYNRQEMLNRSVEMLLPQRFRKQHTTHRGRYMEESKLRPMGADLELFGYRKDNSEMPINIMLSPVSIDGQRFVIAVIRDITKLKEVEDRIRTSLQEKEVMLKEIHHRVKNNLQIISSLLKLQTRQIDDPYTLISLEESRNRIQAMALVHETLYQSQDLAGIDFAHYLQQLMSHFRTAYGSALSGVNINLDVDPVQLDLDTAVSCGLVINELVSNALKYAFPARSYETGEIQIILRHKDNGWIELKISDNGIGFPEDLDFHHTQTLGLQLVNILVSDELEGTIELEKGPGTTFTITLPD
jgi:PAS domain S-box-containing protein